MACGYNSMARQELGFCIMITYGWGVPASLGMTVRLGLSLQLRGCVGAELPLSLLGQMALEPLAASGFQELHRSPMQGISLGEQIPG